jgi:hypothetical protein
MCRGALAAVSRKCLLTRAAASEIEILADRVLLRGKMLALVASLLFLR